MPLSKQRWQEIEKTLHHSFGRVNLKCDGYEITAAVEASKMKLHVMIYIDGRFEGKWLDGKDERCIKFYQCKKMFVLRGAARKKAIACSTNKRLGKEFMAMSKRHLEDHIECWLPLWSSPKAFCRHIQKTCQSIEVVE